MKKKNTILISPIVGLMTILCLLFMAAPVDGKVKKRKPRRKPVVVKVEQQKPVQEEVIDAFSDSLAADALALLGDTLTNDTLPWP